MTDKSTKSGASLEALEEILERFGADRTRWPAPVRRDFAALIASDPEARRRLREAEALDRLLDLAPPPAVDTGALADRILAAAVAEAPAAAFPAAGRALWPVRRGGSEAPWPAAALLAASLVLGAFVGLSGTFDSAMAPLVTQASDDASIDAGRLAFDTDAVGLFEEDLL